MHFCEFILFHSVTLPCSPSQHPGMEIVFSFRRQWKQVTVEDFQSGKQLSERCFATLNPSNLIATWFRKQEMLFAGTTVAERTVNQYSQQIQLISSLNHWLRWWDAYDGKQTNQITTGTRPRSRTWKDANIPRPNSSASCTQQIPIDSSDAARMFVICIISWFDISDSQHLYGNHRDATEIENIGRTSS